MAVVSGVHPPLCRAHTLGRPRIPEQGASVGNGLLMPVLSIVPLLRAGLQVLSLSILTPACRFAFTLAMSEEVVATASLLTALQALSRASTILCSKPEGLHAAGASAG